MLCPAEGEMSCSIVDLSEEKPKSIFIDDWSKDCPSSYTDQIELEPQQDVQQTITEQLQRSSIDNDPPPKDQISLQLSIFDYSPPKRKARSSRVILHDLQVSSEVVPRSASNPFRWSEYFSAIDERAVSEEFFDHYLASISSIFQVDMFIEYCYDLPGGLHWLTRIRLVSHRLLRLHYVGLPDSDTSQDFWADVYGQRCHPIGWCRDQSKLMLPPSLVTKRAVQQASPNNGLDKAEQEERGSLPFYAFDPTVGLTPVEQLKVGMFLELQDLHRPWTLWFVRIVGNRGGRLHLRYVLSVDSTDELSLDTRLFYLHWRVHPVGWTDEHSSSYSYDLPSEMSTRKIDKPSIMDYCRVESKKQFLPENLFREQEEIRPHRFVQGMKFEVFDERTQHVYIGQIDQIHNEFYFDVRIANDQQTLFVAHARHPYLFPAHWAAEHRLALMKGKDLRQSEDYWNVYIDKHGLCDLASERCFHLLTLNSHGSNRVEPGMKMEMISSGETDDCLYSVTLVHVADHLMWLRIDQPSSMDEQRAIYQVLPINSLDLFPVGWAQFNGFQLRTPREYLVQINTVEQDREQLFALVTRCPRIPRVYLTEVYQLTLHVNIRCFSGSHFCSSRLARMPCQFGPGPYRDVLIDMFHHLLSALSATAHRVLRRLEHLPSSNESKAGRAPQQQHLQTEYIKAAKKSGKLIRPISLLTEPRLIHQYIRHICTQLEACPNLLSLIATEQICPDRCQFLSNTFVHSVHSKQKRTGVAQLRAAHQRQRKQKSLLGHLKSGVSSSPATTPLVEELPSIDSPSEPMVVTESESIVGLVLPPGSDRKTRGFRVHIEPRTHTVTRTNRKPKLTTNVIVKEEPIDVLPVPVIVKEPKRPRSEKKQNNNNDSPADPSPSMTMNILSSTVAPTKRKKARRSSPAEDSHEIPSGSTAVLPSPISIPPSRNPVTWNVHDVCSYLNQSGCSFALKTIQEQEIDGAALLLLDDLPKVQDLLEFKLGPAVKFCHVVEQLRTHVIETFHSPPSLLKSKCFSRQTPPSSSS